MKTSIIFGTLLLLGLSSCIPSIYPLYSPETVVTHPSVAGTWTADEEGPWKFTLRDDKSYQLVTTEDGQTASFSVHFVKLGDQLFMDFFPETIGDSKSVLLGKSYFGDLEKNSLYFMHFVPVHTFAKVEISAKSMLIKFYDPDFVKDLFEQRKIRIRHETGSDGQIILSAQTKELQKFLMKYGNDPKAFTSDTKISLTK